MYCCFNSSFLIQAFEELSVFVHLNLNVSPLWIIMAYKFTENLIMFIDNRGGIEYQIKFSTDTLYRAASCFATFLLIGLTSLSI